MLKPKLLIILLLLFYYCRTLKTHRQGKPEKKYDRHIQQQNHRSSQNNQENQSNKRTSKDSKQTAVNVYNLTSIQMQLVQQIAYQIPEVQVSTLKSGVKKQVQVNNEGSQQKNKSEWHYQFIFEKKFKDVVYQWTVNILTQKDGIQTESDKGQEGTSAQEQEKQSSSQKILKSGTIYHVSKIIYTNQKNRKQIYDADIYYGSSTLQLFNAVIAKTQDLQKTDQQAQNA